MTSLTLLKTLPSIVLAVAATITATQLRERALATGGPEKLENGKAQIGEIRARHIWTVALVIAGAFLTRSRLLSLLGGVAVSTSLLVQSFQIHARLRPLVSAEAEPTLRRARALECVGLVVAVLTALLAIRI